MAERVSVREATLADTENLTDLCMRSKQSNGYDDAFMAACAEEMRVRDSWVQDDHFWVAETEDGQMVGCIRLSIDDVAAQGELETCFVEPGWKGRNIGRTLSETLLAKAADERLEKIGLDADPFAEAFYQKLGFAIVGRVPSGSIPGRTLARMELQLRPGPEETCGEGT